MSIEDYHIADMMDIDSDNSNDTNDTDDEISYNESRSSYAKSQRPSEVVIRRSGKITDKDRFLCVLCGGRYQRKNKRQHLQTTKHIKKSGVIIKDVRLFAHK
jgi:transposase-like protein